MKGHKCPECGFEGEPWYESDNDFEYVGSCIECGWNKVTCPECGSDFSYIL